MPKKERYGVKVDKQTLIIANPSKILFPKSKITKADLIDYYKRIAPIMLPSIKGRLVSLFRFPDGIHGVTFFQKEVKESAPQWIEVVPVEKKGGDLVNYLCFSNAASLLYVASLVCVPHIWLSKADKINYPDRMIFDLDPSGKATFAAVVWAAKKVKELLDALQLPSYVMTTGSRGVHVVIPLKRTEDFEQVRRYARALAEWLVEKYPEKLTIEMRKNKRGNRIFIDYLRNAFGATSVAPYAVRSKEGAPIATPVSWEELLSGKVSAQKYHIKNIFRRLSRQKRDPWQDMARSAVSLKRFLKK